MIKKTIALPLVSLLFQQSLAAYTGIEDVDQRIDEIYDKIQQSQESIDDINFDGNDDFFNRTRDDDENDHHFGRGSFLNRNRQYHDDGYIAASYFISWGRYDRKHFVKDFPANDVNMMMYAFFTIDEATGEVLLGDEFADIEAREDEKPSPAGELNGNFKDICALKQEKRDLKVVMSIGGWGNSTKFSMALREPEQRDLFVSSSIQWVKDLCLDGVDIDWEWPGFEREAPTTETEKFKWHVDDGIHLTEVLKGLREGLDEYSQEITDGDYHFLLLAAVAGRPQDTVGYDFDGMIKYLDYWMLMAYDLKAPTLPSTDKVAHLSPIRTTDVDDVSAESIIEFYEEQGVDPARMLLGQPLYARVFNPASELGQEFRDGNNDGVCQLDLDESRDPPQWEQCVWDVKSFPEKDPQGDKIETKFDEEAIAAYAIIIDESDESKNRVLSFPTVETVEGAVELAVEKGLAGHFFWESSQESGLDIIAAATDKAQSLGQELSTENNNLIYPDSQFEFVRHLEVKD